MENKLPEAIQEAPLHADEPQNPSNSPVNNGRAGEVSGPSWVPPRSFRRIFWAVAAVLLVGAVSLAIWRGARADSGQKETVTVAPVFVNVATAQRETVADTVRLEAEFRPYVEDELRAKVSGFLTNIAVDIGDQVKKGQLLAEIEAPELRNELDRARAAEKKAEADHYQADLEYTRLLGVQKANPKVNLVPQQELDNADAKARSTEAAIAAAKADRERYETMIRYTRIYAPYDGVITKRYADPGALIQAGTASDTQSMALVRVSDNYLLRLDFPVSVSWVKDVRQGTPVDVEVESLGGKKFTGKVSRFTRKVDLDTRKMWTEVEVPNPNLEIVPGMYAIVYLKVNQHENALTVPVQAVSNQGKPSVYVVAANNQVEERRVTLGTETPYKWEVLDGLSDGERVIIGNRSELRPGQQVEPKPWIQLTAQ